MRDSCIIYRSFYEAIKELPKENQAECWSAIFEYALNFETNTKLTGISKTVFVLIKPLLDVNNQRYKHGKLGGKYGVQGGNPKLTPNKPQANPKLTPNANDNDNVDKDVDVDANVDKDVNVNVDVNEIKPTSCDSQKSEPPPQFEKPKFKPVPELLHVPCKKIFMDFFKNQNGIEYYWRGRDGKAINGIIKQLRGRGTGDTEIPDVFKTILNKIEDKWMLSNLDVSLLDSKFNQVITKIKNENKQLSYEEINAEYQRRAEQYK